MSENVKKEPDIRFEGFVDSWEQRKLSDLATMHARIGWQNLRTSEFLDSGDYMLITGTDFKDGKIDYSNIHYVEKERYDQDKKIQIKNDSILITKDGTLGKVAMVEGLAMPATLNAGVFNIRVKESAMVDSQYLFHYLKAPFLLKYADSQSTGGTIKHLNQNVLVNFLIPLPIKEEQQKIGIFFKQLDDTIKLHHQKLELLKKTKKGYLQKMFPKNDETIPEIRFEGFSDEWEVKTLGKIFDTITDYVANGSFESLRNNVTSYSDENYAYMIRLQDASNNWKGPWLYTDKDGYDFLNKSELHPNDIIMSNVGSVGKFFLIPELDKPMTLAPNAVLIRSSKNDERFLYQMMLTNSLQVAVKKKTTPGVQSKINKTDFKKIKTQLPSAKEQFKIGNFFKTLDEIVDMEEKTLKELKSLKKSLLQKMFI